jgi:anti-anti-sigma regulatory factor/anti-sigma regulatory factor (Ser/Thr protein kinase)
MSRSTGPHQLDWIESGRCSQRGEVTGMVDPYEQARIAVTAEGAGIRVVRVTGELASGSAADLDEILGQQISARLAGLVIDLSAASFVGVRGIAALVRAADRARQCALALSVVVGEHSEITRVLSRVCREEALLVYTSLDGCLHACRGLLSESDAAASSTAAPNRPHDHSMAGSALTIALCRQPDYATVNLGGELTMAGVGAITQTLAELLLDVGRVVVDLTDLRMGWVPGLQVFASSLAAAGGWPIARLVLFGASPEVSEALRAVDVLDTVPLAADRAAAVARLETRPAALSRHHILDSHLASPRRARALFRRACLDWALGNAYDDAALVVNELVTNVVRHAHTSCRLDIRLDAHGLRVEVRDQGPLPPALLDQAGHLLQCGAGLHLVATLSNRWGIEPHVDGKTVWARFSPRPVHGTSS